MIIFLFLVYSYTTCTQTPFFSFTLFWRRRKKEEKPHYKQCERTKCLWNQANNKKNIINFLRLFLGWKSSRSDRYIYIYLVCVCFYFFEFAHISHFHIIIFTYFHGYWYWCMQLFCLIKFLLLFCFIIHDNIIRFEW